MKISSLLKKFRLLPGFWLILGLTPSFALPPEEPYDHYCPQPWEKPDNSASDFSKRAWFRLGNDYLECLYNYQQEARRNAEQFLAAQNELLEETKEIEARGELTEEVYNDFKYQYDRYEDAMNAWVKVHKDTEKEKHDFARRNGVELE